MRLGGGLSSPKSCREAVKLVFDGEGSGHFADSIRWVGSNGVLIELDSGLRPSSPGFLPSIFERSLDLQVLVEPPQLIPNQQERDRDGQYGNPSAEADERAESRHEFQVLLIHKWLEAEGKVFVAEFKPSMRRIGYRR